MMYVYYFVHLDGDPRLWASELDRDHARLVALASMALRGVRPGLDGDTPEIGFGRSVGRGFSIPISWNAPGLFTGFSGDISIQPINTDSSQIALRASYTADQEGDPADLHRMVETVVKRFLDAVQPVDKPGR